eukprot:scaffold2631_cov96-Isochrysis_galbana.AAC.2
MAGTACAGRLATTDPRIPTLSAGAAARPAWAEESAEATAVPGAMSTSPATSTAPAWPACCSGSAVLRASGSAQTLTPASINRRVAPSPSTQPAMARSATSLDAGRTAARSVHEQCCFWATAEPDPCW